MGETVRIPDADSVLCDRSILTRGLHSEAWRYTGPFTRRNRFKGLFPGFGIASVAFAGYLVYEQIFLKPAHGEHASHAGEGGHH